MAPGYRKPLGFDLMVSFIVLAFVFGGLFWQKHHQAEKLPDKPPSQQGEATTKQVILFFAGNSDKLIPEARQIEGCYDQSSCLRLLVEELVKGPIISNTPVLPEFTVVNSTSVDGNLAIIDLHDDLADTLPSGSLSEILAVYALVNTINTNMPEIAQVKINLDRNETAQLRHLDLSEPLSPDYSHLE